MKLDDDRLTFVAQQEVTALDAIHKAVLGKAACAGRVTEGVGTCISIHAPTWGATPLREHHPDEVDISIHAPMWGATRKPGDGDRSGEISIHAPTWGATVKPSNGWLLGHKDNEFANENIIIINSVNIT